MSTAAMSTAADPLLRVLREPDLRSVLDVAASLDVIERTWRGYGEGQTFTLSQPTSMFAGSGRDRTARYKVKGASLPNERVTGFRLIGDVPVDGGFSSHHLLCVFDDATGAPIGLLDELWLHRFRTALTGVVAARHLARPEASTVALIGAGAIARELFPALEHVFALDHVRVTARRFERAKAFCAEVGQHSRSTFTPHHTVEEAIRGADIIFTLTFADTPVIGPGMLQPGMFLCSMGETEEVELAVLNEVDRFIVDEFEYATVLGDIAVWLQTGKVKREDIAARVDAHIGEVVAGKAPGRLDPQQRIYAIIQGMAICDLALANRALALARDRGLGEQLRLFDRPSAWSRRPGPER